MRSLQQAAGGAVLWPPPPSPLPSPPLPSPPPPPRPPNLLYRVGTAALDKEVVLGSHGYEAEDSHLEVLVEEEAAPA